MYGKRRPHHRGAKKILGPAYLVVLYAGFALLVFVVFDSPDVWAATVFLVVLIYLVGVFTGRPIR